MRGSAETRLVWGIKRSLIEYVEGLEDGTIEIADPAGRNEHEFLFSYDASASQFDIETRTGVLQFRGAVTLRGYAGNLQIQVIDPQLRMTNVASDLLTLTRSMFTGERFDPIVTVSVEAFEPELHGKTRLTNAGRVLLGAQYQVGQEMSNLRIIW